MEKLGMVMVAPRAPTEMNAMFYGWQRRDGKDKDSASPNYFDMEAAQQRVDAAIKEAERHYKIDSKRMVLAGFSQGGGVALKLLAKQPEHFRGGVAVCSLCQKPDSMEWQNALARKSMRVSIIAGEFDKLLERSRVAADVLRAANVPVRFDIIKGLGHEFPEDYVERFPKSINFVLSDHKD